jgi:hypothetical protein
MDENYRLLFRAARDLLEKVPMCERCNGRGSLGPCGCPDCDDKGYFLKWNVKGPREELERAIERIVEGK